MLFSPNESQMPDTPLLWAKIIREDLISARVLLDSGQTRNAILLAASALEKSLKLYLALAGRLTDEDATHNIALLAKKAGLLEDAPQNVKEAFLSLSKMHVPSSYPANDVMYELLSNSAYAQAVYNSAFDAVKWVLEKAGLYGGGSRNV